MTESAEHHGADADDTLAEEIAALRADRDEMEQRALEAEAVAEALADELADARRRLAGPPDPTKLTIFDEVGTSGGGTGRSIAGDGTDKGVLPLGLGAIAVVAFLVALLAVFNGSVLIGFVMLGVGCFLAYWSYQTRVIVMHVSIDDGVVAVASEGTTKRFDLRNEQIKVDVRGAPGDADWRVRFYRRALDPVDVDASAVDPAAFMAELRAFRPGL